MVVVNATVNGSVGWADRAALEGPVYFSSVDVVFHGSTPVNTSK